MADQFTFADVAWNSKRKTTKRETFLAEMDAVIPWQLLLDLIAPHYPVAGNGRRPIDLAKMLRIHFLQQWFDLSDPGAEEALYDSRAMQRFVGITLGEDVIPDETTILNFRHLLEAHDLPQQIFAAIRELLQAEGIMVKHGTIVDATILAAPSSTKNKAQARDPEMHQTKKGNAWHFGMKVHVGADPTGLVHSVTTTDASVADITELPKLVHGEEEAIYGDRAYWKQQDRQQCLANRVQYRVNIRGTKNHPVTEHQRRINRSRSRVRARVEHVFHVMKRLWRFTKVRYRGLKKNTARVLTTLALANLYLARRRLAV